jgi:beta-lactamase regulating signal transducer with metallopeptidase domain
MWFAVIACLTLPFGLQVDTVLGSTALMVEPHSIGPNQDNRDHSATANVDPEDTSIQVERSISGVSGLHLSNTIAHSSVRAIVVFSWLIVAVVLLALTLWNLVRYFRVKSRASAVDATTADLFNQCKLQVMLRRHVGLLETADIQSPAMFGWWSPTLLLPIDLSSQLSTGQLRHIFLHELAHVQRRDILVNWLVTLVQIVHWFNPLVWYSLRKLRDDMELACDARVIGRLPKTERVDYGNTLIKLADCYPVPLTLAHGAGIAENHAQLKRRVQMIAQFSPVNIKRSLFALCVLTALTSVAVTQPRIDANSHLKPLASNSTSESANRSVAPEQQQSASVLPPSLAPITVAASTQSKIASDRQKSNPTNVTEKILSGSEVTANKESLHTEYRRLNYAKASDLAALIKPGEGASLLSKRGNVVVDERTNTLVLQDTTERLSDIQQLLGALDVPVQRIQMSMRIMVADEELSRDLAAFSEPVSTNAGGAAIQRAAENLTIAANPNFEAKLLEALEGGRAEMVAVPRLITINRKEAMVQQGIEFPQQVSSTGTAITKPRKVVLTLKLTPTLVSSNRIDLDLDSLIRAFEPSGATSQDTRQSNTSTRRTVTKVLLNDGYTLVLDRLLENERTDSKRKLLVLVTATVLPKQEPLYPVSL